MIPPVFVHCGFGLLMVVFSIPLVLRKVPMNRGYGIRIPKAFASEQSWYAINAYGGKLFLAYGVLLVVFGLCVRHLAPSPTSIWMAVFTVGPLVLALLILPAINAYAKRLPD